MSEASVPARKPFRLSWAMLAAAALVVLIVGIALQFGRGSTGWSSEERAYVDAAAAWSKSYPPRLKALREISQRPQFPSGPYLENMQLHIANVRDTNEEILAYKPPARFQNVHANMVRVAHIYDGGMDSYKKGLETRDRVWFAGARAELEKATPILDQISEEVNRINEAARRR